MYRGNFRKFPQRWKFSTHKAFVYECCEGHCDGRRSCFQQSSTDFVGSCGFVRTEGHEFSACTPCAVSFLVSRMMYPARHWQNV